MSRNQRGQNRRGAVLIVVLVVVMMLTLGAYAFTELMQTENHAVQLTGRQIQARAFAESGESFLESYLAQEPEYITELGGIYDNPAMFQGQLLVDDEEDERQRGRFTILAPLVDIDGYLDGIRYGLEDESARLNLNALLMLEEQSGAASELASAAGLSDASGAAAASGAGASATITGLASDEALTSGSTGRQLLMGLPGMTEDIADAILDYIDEDDEPREFGAEVDYYSGLDPPYAPKNGPLETVEELLLVRGVTPQLLFGRDENRNGVIDPQELALSPDADRFEQDMLTEAPERGWTSFLTLYGMEKNYGADGAEKIFINDEDVEALHARLLEVVPQEWADFIVAYRMYGASTSTSNATNQKYVTSVQFDFSQEPKGTFASALDLIDAVVSVTQSNGGQNSGQSGQAQMMKSPFQQLNAAQWMPDFMELLTVNESPIIPGRININQAPRELLLAIPGMTEEAAEAIIASRVPVADEENPLRAYETWIWMEGIVTLDEMKTLLPLVNAGGDVHRAQIVGYYEGGLAFSRHEAVIDATQPEPRLLLWRDISHLGRGHPLEVLGIGLGFTGAAN
ncbi:type II secretion system protein GspK [Blastopirellula marina]|uniref:Probable general secretion pathway protein K n=1 Tax=Blastopirellula marina DSM 3645 TaxID=314230 RepID=A3ZWZ4_9BACT|nr:type II secretion system protein GspK [Blastopirellula marina]EAQ78869.1 probable general secretion pathway protein K [Blastopirellula marina DSM 3645]